MTDELQGLSAFLRAQAYGLQCDVVIPTSTAPNYNPHTLQITCLVQWATAVDELQAARATPADQAPVVGENWQERVQLRMLSMPENTNVPDVIGPAYNPVEVELRATPADQEPALGKDVWEYSFVHSSALGRPDEKVTMLTYEKENAFKPECFDQKLVCSVGMFVAEVSQDSDGFKHIADVVELDDIPAGTRLYAIAAGNVAAPQPEAQSVRDAWISVDERLPEALTTPYKPYLVFGHSFDGPIRSDVGGVVQFSRDLGRFLPFIFFDQELKISHWQPLPAPPQKPAEE